MKLERLLPIGTLLENRYVIRSVLGQGGMSRVYLADDLRLNIPVAVKENLQIHHESGKQFAREAELLANLAHPNIPKVTDYFVDAQTRHQFLVMEYIAGDDLHTRLAQIGALPETQALKWIRQVMSALEYIHTRTPPIIHRDIKPANIKITPDGKAVFVDFGISKKFELNQATVLGARAVTPGYAPPEQYASLTDERSDIYALGATLCTLLTARIPPEAPLRQSGVELTPPRAIAPHNVSTPTDRAILRALELDPHRRWRNIAEFRAALDTRNSIATTPPARTIVLHERTKFGRMQIGIAIMFLAVSAILGLTLTRRNETPQTQAALAPTVALPMATPTISITPRATETQVIFVITATPLSTATSTLTPTPTATPVPSLIVLRDTLTLWSRPEASIPSPCRLGVINKGARVLLSEGELNTRYNTRQVRITVGVLKDNLENSAPRSGGSIFSSVDHAPIGKWLDQTSALCINFPFNAPIVFLGNNPADPTRQVDLIVQVWVEERILRLPP